MSQDLYFKVPVNNNIKLKSSVSMRLPLMDNEAYGHIFVKSKTGEGNVKYQVSLESLLKMNAAQAAELVSRAFIPKAIRYALGYHYFGYPLVNTSTDSEGNLYFPRFGKTENFNGIDAATGQNLGTPIEIATKLGLNNPDYYRANLYEYLRGTFGESSGQTGTFTNWFNAKVDPISQTVNGGNVIGEKDVKVGTQNVFYDDIHQPLTKTHAKMWNPGSKTAMYLGGSTPPYNKGFDGVKSDKVFSNFLSTNIGQNGALRYLVGPKANSKWYYDQGPATTQEQKDFKTSNLITSFNLLPAGSTSDLAAALAYGLAPNTAVDASLPKIWSYIINVAPKITATEARGIYTQSVQAKDGQGFEPDPLKFIISAVDNTSLGKQDPTKQGSPIVKPEDLKTLGFTNVLGGYYPKTEVQDVDESNLTAYAGADLIFLPKNIKAYRVMKSLAKLGMAFEGYSDPSDGDGGNATTSQWLNQYDPKRSGFLVKELEEKGFEGTINLEDLQQYFDDTGSKYYIEKHYVNGKKWEEYLKNWDAGGIYEITDPLTYMKSFSDWFCAGFYKKIPKGAKTTSNFTKLANTSRTTDFKFPVWSYSKEKLAAIGYERIIDSDSQSSLNQFKTEIQNNPEVLLQENTATPDWVNSIQIYPSITEEYIGYGIALADQNNLYSTNNTLAKAGWLQAQEELYSFKSNEAYRDVALSHVATWKGYKTGQNWNGSAGLPWIGIDIDDNGVPYAELRYVLELEIDEAKLITDMVRRNVFTPNGEASQYEAAGFDIDQLVLASKGNVYNESLKVAYAEAVVKDTGPSIDFSEFPFLVTGESEVGQVLPNEIYLEAQKVVDARQDPKSVSSIVFSKEGLKTVAFKEAPGPRAKNIGYLDNLTLVRVIQESVNGKGQYNKVEVVDLRSQREGQIGYIEPKDLVTLNPPTTPVVDSEGKTVILTIDYPKFFNDQFKQEGYTLGETEILPMSEMARALVPTWWKNREPYYHREEGNYYITVVLPYQCITDKADLDSKKKEAVKKGIVKLLDYYNKQYQPSDIDKLAETYLATEYVDYNIDLRPGSYVKMLVKVGGIYLNGFPTEQDNLQELKQQTDKVISLDASFYQKHLEQAVFGLNKLYIELFASNFALKGFNIIKEAQRLESIDIYIKKLILLNGYDLKKPGNHVIDVGFTDEYKVVYISYKEEGSEEKLLSIGFKTISNLSPFIDKNTMALFYYHRQLRNPTLTWQKLVNEYLPEPKPQIVQKSFGDGGFDHPSNRCAPPSFVGPDFSSIIEGLASRLDQQLDIDPRFDLGAFEFSLRSFLPPCPKPPSGRGDALFKTVVDLNGEQNVYENLDILFNLTQERDRIQEYVGDFLTSATALRDIRNKVVNLDDLHKYVTSMIDVPTLYNTLCRCFIDIAGIEDITLPNFEMKASGGSVGASPSAALQGKSKDEILQMKGPSADISTEPLTVDAADLYCSFCLEVPDLFIRLPTTNILQFMIDALMKLLEFILSQLLLELIAALLEALLTCPDIQCPPGQGNLKDYGGQDLNNILDKTGVGPNEKSQFFDACGVTGISEQDIQSFLSNVSNSLTSGEVLDLFDGSADIEVYQNIQKILAEYPTLQEQMPSKSKIEDFFTCMGLQMPIEIIDEIEKDIATKFKDPEICRDILEDTKGILEEKCGIVSDADKIAARAEGTDVEKYKTLADIIRRHNDLSTQLPALFSDGKGSSGLMSQINTPTMEYAVEKAATSLVLPIEVALTQESRAYTRGSSTKGLIIEDPNLKQITAFPQFVAAALAPYLPNLKNRIVNDVDTNAIGGISESIISVKSENGFIMQVNADNLTTLSLKPPVKKNGKLTYTDNFNIFVKDNRLGDFNISPTTVGGISEEQEKLLDKYPLFDDQNYSEQSQYFSSLLLNHFGLGQETNLGGQTQVIIKDDTATEQMKKLAAKNIFFSIYESMFREIGSAISEGELLKFFDVGIFDQINESSYASAADRIPLAGGLTALFSLLGELKVYRSEIENIDFTPTDSSTSSDTLGMINFPLVKEIIKKNYDFSQYYDPNSEELGMPHHAMLEGLITATVQMFVADFFVKSIFVISKIPIDFFMDDYSLIDVIVKEMELFMSQKVSSSQASFFKEAVLRVISNKSEWEFNSPENTKYNSPGKIYDASLAKEVNINNWKDATKYFIRQYYKSAVIFVKDRLNKTELKDNGVVISGKKRIEQINPLTLLSYPNILEIYDSVSNKDIGISSICSAERINEFKDGKFFYQYYYELVDWDEGEPLYNQKLIKARKLNGYNGKLSAEKMREFLKNMYLGLTYQDLGIYGFEITADYGFTSGYIDKLKSETNADKSVNVPLKSLFKDIRIGVRHCYGYAYTGDSIVGDNGNIYIMEPNQTLKEIQSVMFTLFYGNAANSSLNNGFFDGATKKDISSLETTIQDTIKREKSIRLIENEVAATDGKDEERISYIFPLIERSTSIANWDEGYLPQDKGGLVTFDKGLYEIVHGINNEDFSYTNGTVQGKIGDLFFEERIQTITFNLLKDMINSDDFQLIYKYCFSVPKILYTMSIYSILAVSSPRVNNAFDRTKKTIFDQIKMVGDVKGNEAYKQEPDSIKQQGGPSGIAKTSIKGAP